jgi:cation transport ATPase
MPNEDRQMHKKFLAVSIVVLLIGLLLGLSRVVAQEASDGVTATTQVEPQRRHVLGDGVADTPVEVDALQRGDHVVSGLLKLHRK